MSRVALFLFLEEKTRNGILCTLSPKNDVSDPFRIGKSPAGRSILALVRLPKSSQPGLVVPFKVTFKQTDTLPRRNAGFQADSPRGFNWDSKQRLGIWRCSRAPQLP